MPHPFGIRIDPRDYKISRLLFRRIWRLAKPFWARKEAWRAWVAMSFLLIMVPAMTATWVYTSELSKTLTNVIVAKDQAKFYTMLPLFVGFGLASSLVYMGMNFIDTRLELAWRQWLTMHIVDRYLNRRTYYDIAVAEDLDNPDQRIQEDIKPFVSTVSNFPRTILSNILQLIMGGIILAGITPGLFWFVAVYAVVQTAVTLWLYTPTIKQNFEITVAEADLRYGILHVRDNAETVAFYGGEHAERSQIEGRLSHAVRKHMIALFYGVKMNMVNQVVGLAWTLMPYLMLVPLFFNGKIDYGAIAQATMAASTMLGAMTMLVNFIPTVSASAPKAVRLAAILERFDEMDAQHDDESIPRLRIEPNAGEAIRLRGVSLQTPGGEQALVRELDVEVSGDDHLIIVGQTGVGKSSLLRAMAGLWRRGTGVLEMPPRDQCLFLPQRPYMILANLRSQLLYPRGSASTTDEELQRVLERVCLPHLIEKHGGLDTARDWSKVLSLGEQQRIAFARVLISAPKYVFLDEATSAVDIETERRLYNLLSEAGVTYVSVGHRETILAHHTRALRLFADRSWDIVPALQAISRLGALLPLSPSSPVADGTSLDTAADRTALVAASAAGMALDIDTVDTTSTTSTTSVETTTSAGTGAVHDHAGHGLTLARTFGGFRLDISVEQLQGTRRRQEDSYLIEELGDVLLLAVADGMGGHPHGDEASRIALETLRCNIQRLFRPPVTPYDCSVALHSALSSAHAAVRLFGDDKTEEGKRPGTTLVAVALLPTRDAWTFAAVGDSHIYHLNGTGKVKRVNKLHGENGKISSWVGGELSQIDGAGEVRALSEVTALVLASDGLNVLPVPVVDSAVRNRATAHEAVREMLGKVTFLEHPKQDNVTALVIRVSAEA